MVRENGVDVAAEVRVANKAVGLLVLGQQLLNFRFLEFYVEGSKACSELYFQRERLI